MTVTKKAETLGNAKDKFSEVEEGSTIYVEKGRVVAVVGETDADTDTKDVTGLVTGVKRTTGQKAQFTIKVLGETQRLVSKDKYTQAEVDKFDKDYTNTIVTLVVGETSNEVEGFDYKDGYKVIIDRISGRTIYGKDSNKKDVAVELNTKAVIYDVNDDFDELNLRELKSGMEITVYHEGSSARFVDYILVGIVSGTPTESGVVTYINDSEPPYGFEVDGKAYVINAQTRLVENGVTKAMGDEVVFKAEVKLAIDDKVEVKDNVITIIKRADARALDQVKINIQKAIDKAVATEIFTDIEAAKDLVWNEWQTNSNITAAEADAYYDVLDAIDTVIVKDDAQLTKALSQAQYETIILADGSYGNITVSRAVVIESLNEHKAYTGKVTIDSDDVTVDGLTAGSINFHGVDNIVIKNNVITSNEATVGIGAAYGQENGPVTIIDNLLYDGSIGLYPNKALNNYVITGNTVRKALAEGIWLHFTAGNADLVTEATAQQFANQLAEDNTVEIFGTTAVKVETNVFTKTK